MSNKSIYPEIIIDENAQCANPEMPINVTAEMWYDIMHHTHSAGGTSDSESENAAISALLSRITELENKVETMDAALKEHINTSIYILPSENSGQSDTSHDQTP